MPRKTLTALLGTSPGLGFRGYSGIRLRTFFLTGEGEGPGRVRDPALASLVGVFVWRVSSTNVSCLWCTLAEWLVEAPARSTNQPRRVHAAKHDVLGNRSTARSTRLWSRRNWQRTSGRQAATLRQSTTIPCAMLLRLCSRTTRRASTSRRGSSTRPSSRRRCLRFARTTYYYYVVCWPLGSSATFVNYAQCFFRTQLTS